MRVGRGEARQDVATGALAALPLTGMARGRCGSPSGCSRRRPRSHSPLSPMPQDERSTCSSWATGAWPPSTRRVVSWAPRDCAGGLREGSR
jgi:hypothetical protein